MDQELNSTTAKSTEWVNDWDLLSPRFQTEAAGYLQVVAVIVIVFLVRKRVRGLALAQKNTEASS